MMDQMLKELSSTHRLTAINVSYGADHGRFSVFLHWDGNGFTYAYGASVDEALKLALADMSQIRADASRHSGEAA